MNLKKLSYAEAAHLLAEKSDEELIDVLAGSSRKLGDTAWGMLARRNREDLVIQALRDGRFLTRDGKVRALNFLLVCGRSLPEALPVYQQYAADRSADAASCALFGLVFWGDASVIPFLESLVGGKNSEKIELAIAALRSGDPGKYSPGFHDAEGVWRKD